MEPRVYYFGPPSIVIRPFNPNAYGPNARTDVNHEVEQKAEKKGNHLTQQSVEQGGNHKSQQIAKQQAQQELKQGDKQEVKNGADELNEVKKKKKKNKGKRKRYWISPNNTSSDVGVSGSSNNVSSVGNNSGVQGAGQPKPSGSSQSGVPGAGQPKSSGSSQSVLSSGGLYDSRFAPSSSQSLLLQPPRAVTLRTPQAPAAIRSQDPNSSVLIQGAMMLSNPPVNRATQSASLKPAPPVLNETWKTWDEVTVKLRGLPPTLTTLDLYNAFRDEGPIDFIEIYEDQDGRRDSRGKIRFRPPPKRSFWFHQRYALRLGSPADTIWVPVTLENTKPATIPSPVNPQIELPQTTVLHPVSIDFGYLHDTTTMVAMRSVPSRSMESMTFELDLLRKHLDIRFTMSITDPRQERLLAAGDPTYFHPNYQSKSDIGRLNREEKYRFRIPLEQLKTIQEVDEHAQRHSLIIGLDTPPNFYRKAAGTQLERSHDKNTLYWAEWYTWFRQTDIMYDHAERKNSPLSLRKTQPVIDIGRWTTYRFTFAKSERGLTAYNLLGRALRDHNVSIVKVENFQMVTDQKPAVWEWIDPRPLDSSAWTSFADEIQGPIATALSYPVRYQLEVCISQGRLNEHNLGKDFVDMLSQMDERKAIDILQYAAQQKNRIYNPMTLFELKSTPPSISGLTVPHYCAYVRKVTITPSMIYLATPTVETTNRVLRQYIEHSDRFLRVQFTDEKFEGRIHSTDKNTNDEIYTRVRRALMNGIVIGDRHYEFLAFGNSQFREHGAFFFAPTLHLTSEDIRRWMGNFAHIKEVARYASRLGQCFSTTRAINGTKVHVVEIADVKKYGYNFTDGVGKMSESLAKLVAGELRLPFVPSVVQFRLGGCKGILAVWPDARKWEIHIRPSQYKFAALHNGLEIIRWSQFASAALNRQLILILSTLGVPDKVFMKKIQDMLADLEKAMIDEKLVSKMLQKHVDMNQMTITLAGMVLGGFMRRKEPFMMSVLQLWRAWTIRDLKERAKIVLDEGAFVLGCTDETKTLKGHFNISKKKKAALTNDPLSMLPEIFLQISDPNEANKYRVIQGVCVLARNPSLHPGDIRVVVAVDKPQLHHIRDAVVFPQTGDRDVASMCSGGDLDGDDFLVIWDAELLPKEWNYPPMDYSRPQAVELNRDVEKNDITDFFVQYMKNDRLGTIARSHLAQADFSSKGSKDEKCLRLAALHSKAVDYVKTGQPASMPRELRPRKWPHFMQKEHLRKDQVYKSAKILGKLYDKVERVDFIPMYHSKFDSRILDAYKLEDIVLQSARDIKTAYDADMRRIMAQHGIGTEFEVWSTFVLTHFNATKDFKLYEEMGQIAFGLKDRYRNICIQQAGSKNFEVLGPFVAAMYKVTQEEIESALEETRRMIMVEGESKPMRELSAHTMPLMSFPWCFEEILGKIASQGGQSLKKSHHEESARGGAKRNNDVNPDTSGYQEAQSMRPVEEDLIETAEGVTHRGEILELFQHGHGEAKKRELHELAQTSMSDLSQTYATAAERQERNAAPFHLLDAMSDEESGMNMSDPASGLLSSQFISLLDLVEDKQNTSPAMRLSPAFGHSEGILIDLSTQDDSGIEAQVAAGERVKNGDKERDEDMKEVVDDEANEGDEIVTIEMEEENAMDALEKLVS